MTAGMASAGTKLEDEILKVKAAIENRIGDMMKVGDYQLSSVEGTVGFKGAPFGIGLDGSIQLTWSIPKPQGT